MLLLQNQNIGAIKHDWAIRQASIGNDQQTETMQAIGFKTDIVIENIEFLSFRFQTETWSPCEWPLPGYVECVHYQFVGTRGNRPKQQWTVFQWWQGQKCKFSNTSREAQWVPYCLWQTDPYRLEKALEPTDVLQSQASVYWNCDRYHSLNIGNHKSWRQRQFMGGFTQLWWSWEVPWVTISSLFRRR